MKAPVFLCILKSESSAGAPATPAVAPSWTATSVDLGSVSSGDALTALSVQSYISSAGSPTATLSLLSDTFDTVGTGGSISLNGVLLSGAFPTVTADSAVQAQLQLSNSAGTAVLILSWTVEAAVTGVAPAWVNTDTVDFGQVVQGTTFSIDLSTYISTLGTPEGTFDHDDFNYDFAGDTPGSLTITGTTMSGTFAGLNDGSANLTWYVVLDIDNSAGSAGTKRFEWEVGRLAAPVHTLPNINNVDVGEGMAWTFDLGQFVTDDGFPDAVWRINGYTLPQTHVPSISEAGVLSGVAPAVATNTNFIIAADFDNPAWPAANNWDNHPWLFVRVQDTGNVAPDPRLGAFGTIPPQRLLSAGPWSLDLTPYLPANFDITTDTLVVDSADFSINGAVVSAGEGISQSTSIRVFAYNTTNAVVVVIPITILVSQTLSSFAMRRGQSQTFDVAAAVASAGLPAQTGWTWSGASEFSIDSAGVLTADLPMWYADPGDLTILTDTHNFTLETSISHFYVTDTAFTPDFFMSLFRSYDGTLRNLFTLNTYDIANNVINTTNPITAATSPAGGLLNTGAILSGSVGAGDELIYVVTGIYDQIAGTELSLRGNEHLYAYRTGGGNSLTYVDMDGYAMRRVWDASALINGAGDLAQDSVYLSTLSNDWGSSGVTRVNWAICQLMRRRTGSGKKAWDFGDGNQFPVVGKWGSGYRFRVDGTIPVENDLGANENEWLYVIGSHLQDGTTYWRDLDIYSLDSDNSWNVTNARSAGTSFGDGVRLRWWDYDIAELAVFILGSSDYTNWEAQKIKLAQSALAVFYEREDSW